MIRTTPFHERTAALNETHLWSHWSGTLAADRYQMSDKFEYFAVRNAAGIFDSSPLYKYRIAGKDAEAFLAGVLARDIRACPPGHAQYTCWLDDGGFVIEDGVILRTGQGRVPPHLGRAQLRLLRGPHRPDGGHDRGGQRGDRHARPAGPALARPARPARAPDARHPLLRGREGRDRRRGGDRQPDRLQRRPRLRDLDRAARRAPRLGHALGQHRGPRRPAVRARGAVHAPHRGRAAAARRRLRLQPVRLERRRTSRRRSSSAGRGCSRTSPATTGRSSAARRSSARSPTRPRAGRCAASSSTGGTTIGSTTRPG